MESPSNDGSIPFLDTKYLPNEDRFIHTSVYRKPTHTTCYLSWDSNHLISAKESAVYALIYRVKNVYSASKALSKQMEYLHHVLMKNNYPKWMIKNQKRKPVVPPYK